MTEMLNVVWLQSGGCGGCTISLLNSDSRDLFGSLKAAGLCFLWHPALSEESGAEALEVLERCASGAERLDILCVEGSLLRGPRGTGRFHMLAGTGLPMTDWVRRLAAQARHIVAIGSCASFGGITAAGANPAEACGLQYEGELPGGLLGPRYRSQSGMPVINVAGCPTHPGWVTDSLMAIAMGSLGGGDLDEFNRPRLYTSHLVHHGCNRNEYYEFKASAEKPSDLGCLMENMGCMGTQAHADCNIRLWNGSGSCVRGGFACVRCTEPEFEEPGHPFARTPKVAGIPLALPTDMPKAWFIALSALSKSATPKRVRDNAVADHQVVVPQTKKPGPR